MTEFAYPGRVAIAVLAIATAMIRFSSVPAHATNGAGGAVAVAIAGWLGLLVAASVVFRGTRVVLAAALTAYVAIVVVSLVSGVSSSFAELSLLGIEIAVVAACTFVLAVPAFGSQWDGSTFVLLSIAPVGVLALATAVVASPAATATTVAARPKAPAITKTSSATARTPGTLGSGLSNAGNADEQVELKPNVPLDAAAQKRLAAQLVAARAAAMKYPTVGDAKRAGMIAAGGMAPGVGAHYLSIASTLQGVSADGSVNASHPGSYIYAGTRDDSPIVGLMYESLTSSPEPPTGFAGPNDHWHRHSNLCIQYKATGIAVPFVPDADVTREQCDSVQGQFMAKSIWMVHAWVVPGYESPKGVFSHNNNDVHCPDGTNGVNSIGFCVHQ